MPLTMAYLALGSNLGERLKQMRSALEILEADGNVQIVRASPVYQNRAIGMGEADPFLNAVVKVKTSLSPEALLDLCLSTENKLGRVRTDGWSPRTIDIDVLLYGEIDMDTERLRLPHPAIAERDFVVQPLLDIAPDLEINGQSLQSIKDALPVFELEEVDAVLW
ncbi:2-amino-4-hydroxy-6-hydroxymethyldihydropteridine diphosphokinase [Rubellicoccus peritrichatus]|uniref:2-amino-4-hydroxy-6-hydroxymethyldihydropteridine pyrophosphokinase n=1 Tax=Rubellicoccus peritrichatus TaxID=3080537 RepID=A0AAQ3LFL9_9BACT|nr:2-amino-4-hydroxy-6-hydroxymethyldihydropteridine diphosphokinase [Puniceicoccus sp. CR14]WOO41164.1 2-amino-4-hydroxy-6-hydroxymethyldihydropteridine diphosphokinase [Puniceicoccus sp. CR14]